MRVSAPDPRQQQVPAYRTMYKVTFTSYDGVPYRLDTTNPENIGPWLAEMYGLFPYLANAQTGVDIKTIEGFR